MLSYLIKTGFIAVIIFGLNSCTSRGCKKGRILKNNELPGAAHAFVRQHFPGTGYIRIDKAGSLSNKNNVYEVELANHLIINFDATGNWQNIHGFTPSKFPSQILPQKILQHIHASYPEDFIYLLHMENNFYNVHLSNDRKLVYDNKGRFVEKT